MVFAKLWHQAGLSSLVKLGSDRLDPFQVRTYPSSVVIGVALHPLTIRQVESIAYFGLLPQGVLCLWQEGRGILGERMRFSIDIFSQFRLWSRLRGNS